MEAVSGWMLWREVGGRGGGCGLAYRAIEGIAARYHEKQHHTNRPTVNLSSCERKDNNNTTHECVW